MKRTYVACRSVKNRRASGVAVKGKPPAGACDGVDNNNRGWSGIGNITYTASDMVALGANGIWGPEQTVRDSAVKEDRNGLAATPDVLHVGGQQRPPGRQRLQTRTRRSLDILPAAAR